MKPTIVARMGNLRGFCNVLLAILLSFSFLAAPGQAQERRLNDDLFGVSFPDDQNGWVCGRWGTILHTTDGGKTWAPQESSTEFTLSAMCFTDEKNGWAVGDEGAIVHTSDGGNTWARQESPAPLFLMDVFFTAPEKGWIVTEETTILHTEDGGKTWMVQFQDEDYILKAVSFADEAHGWAVGEYGYIYRTADGGATWEKQAGFFDISDLDGSIVAGTFLFDVAAVDKETAWAVGIDSYITMTSDAGKSWREVPVDLPKTHLFSIAIPDRDTILIAGRGTFVCSTDAGKTWRNPSFNPPMVYDWLYKITSISDNRFITVGREGALYIGTIDAWEKVTY